VEYKGYITTVSLDEETALFHGEIVNMRDVVTFQGTSICELEKEFRASVDDYYRFCASRGEQPLQPFRQ
jgi:predicted HicB family RNase H-like nuclease